MSLFKAISSGYWLYVFVCFFLVFLSLGGLAYFGKKKLKTAKHIIKNYIEASDEQAAKKTIY